jgi:ketosteroid isomerase-like protein
MPSFYALEKLISAALADYATQEMQRFPTYLHNDIVYVLYLDQTLLPFAGEVVGKSTFLERLQEMRADFEYLLWDPSPPRPLDRETVQAAVTFRYRHRKTGEILDGTYRLIFKVGNDLLIHRIEEYHDVERVHAFMRLLAQRDA